MASRVSSSVTSLFLFTVTLLVIHATARNLQQTQTLPLHGPATSPKAVEENKNFVYGGGIGGAAGVGGFFGMPGGTGMTLPLPTTGSPLLGGSGAFGSGGLGGLGGAMGFPGVPTSPGGVKSP